MAGSLGPRGLQPARLLRPGDSPGKNAGVGCHALLRSTFPTQGSNPGLLHCRQILYHLSHGRSSYAPIKKRERELERPPMPPVHKGIVYAICSPSSIRRTLPAESRVPGPCRESPAERQPPPRPALGALESVCAPPARVGQAKQALVRIRSQPAVAPQGDTPPAARPRRPLRMELRKTPRSQRGQPASSPGPTETKKKPPASASLAAGRPCVSSQGKSN